MRKKGVRVNLYQCERFSGNRWGFKNVAGERDDVMHETI